MASKFCWYELMTDNMFAAEAFYREVVGWSARDSGNPNIKYSLFSVGETPVAGLFSAPPDAPQGQAKPGWLGYVHVDDVDSSLGKAQELGAKVCHPATDIPNIGRFAIFTDPQGSTVALFKPTGGMTAPAPMTPGTVGWHELHTNDSEKAFDFYSAMFGWQKIRAMDMGPAGNYSIFGDESAPMGFGGMYTDSTASRPYWLYYFAVADIDAAAARVAASGGKVTNGPMEVPGGAWIIQGTDPQGAVFALVGMRAQGAA